MSYKNPPIENRFKKGVSGNPSGRPKGSKNTYKLLEDILNQKVSVTQDGKAMKISKKQAILLQMANSAVKGNVKAIQILFPHMTEIDSKNEQKSSESLNPNDKEIIKIFLEGNSNDQW